MKVKICGITNSADALSVIEAGAAYIGFVFAKSPRMIDIKRAEDICAGLVETGLRSRIKIAGVFVNENPAVMKSYIDMGIIDIAQIHGDETAAECSLFDFPYIRALRVKDLSEPAAAEAFTAEISALTCKTVLIDSFSEKVYGGSGIQVALDSAITASRLLRSAGKEFFIAGGLTPDNVGGIVTAVRPDGIDVSGGVEKRPGVKSRDKIIRLMKAVSGGDL